MDRIGLCQTCAFSRVVENARGGRFYLCRLWERDSRFVKYPALPVRRCAGYAPTGGAQRSAPSRRLLI